MKYEYRVHYTNCYTGEGFEELESLLNAGWQIERADHDGDGRAIVYILKCLKEN